MRDAVLIAGLALVGVPGCETYEFPPRLVGVGTEDCPQCEALVLSETRLPAGSVDINARFAFEDDLGTLSKVQVFVTTPSGVVLGEPDPSDDEASRPGFTCTYATELAVDVGSRTCEVSSTRANAISSTDVGERIAGYQAGVLSATFGLETTEFGEWTVEFVATRSDGTPSNRISNTFDVVDDVGVDTDGDRVDPGTETGTGTETE